MSKWRYSVSNIKQINVNLVMKVVKTKMFHVILGTIISNDCELAVMASYTFNCFCNPQFTEEQKSLIPIFSSNALYIITYFKCLKYYYLNKINSYKLNQCYKYYALSRDYEHHSKLLNVIKCSMSLFMNKYLTLSLINNCIHDNGDWIHQF